MNTSYSARTQGECITVTVRQEDIDDPFPKDYLEHIRDIVISLDIGNRARIKHFRSMGDYRDFKKYEIIFQISLVDMS